MGVNLLLGGPVLSYITADTLSRTLQDLDVSQTDTSGTIPTEVGKLTKLTNLGIWTVPLSGTIPSEIGAMTSLRTYQAERIGSVCVPFCWYPRLNIYSPIPYDVFFLD